MEFKYSINNLLIKLILENVIYICRSVGPTTLNSTVRLTHSVVGHAAPGRIPAGGRTQALCEQVCPEEKQKE